MLQHYLNHRRVIIVRRTEYELREAEKKAHILEGLKIALDFIDEVIKLIRASKDIENASSDDAFQTFGDSVQCNSRITLQKLTSLESKKIMEEFNDLKTTIKN